MVGTVWCRSLPLLLLHGLLDVKVVSQPPPAISYCVPKGLVQLTYFHAQAR